LEEVEVALANRGGAWASEDGDYEKVRKGLLKAESPRGVWELSESGRARLARG
jgi:hypothetical protein